MKLNIGCGNDIRDGYVNIDNKKLEGVDLVFDVNKLPLPFDNKSVEFVLCLDLLEHIDYISLLGEINRVLKKNGKIEIQVPHFNSRFNFIDPTHINRFSIQTFEFFLKESFFKREYYNNFYFDHISKRRIRFEKSIFFPWNYILEPIINVSLSMQIYYEATFLSRIFPASNIQVWLVK